MPPMSGKATPNPKNRPQEPEARQRLVAEFGDAMGAFAAMVRSVRREVWEEKEAREEDAGSSASGTDPCTLRSVRRGMEKG